MRTVTEGGVVYVNGRRIEGDEGHPGMLAAAIGLLVPRPPQKDLPDWARAMLGIVTPPRVYKGRGQRKNRRDKAGRAIHALKVEDDQVHLMRGPGLRFKCAR